MRLLEFLWTTTKNRARRRGGEWGKSNFEMENQFIIAEFDHNKNSSMRFISMYFISYSDKNHHHHFLLLSTLPLSFGLILSSGIIIIIIIMLSLSLTLCFIIDFDTHTHTANALAKKFSVFKRLLKEGKKKRKRQWKNETKKRVLRKIQFSFSCAFFSIPKDANNMTGRVGTRKWNKIGYLLTYFFLSFPPQCDCCCSLSDFNSIFDNGWKEKANQIKVGGWKSQNMWAMAAWNLWLDTLNN